MSYRLTPDISRFRAYTYILRIRVKQYLNDSVVDAFVDVFDLYYLQRIAYKTGLLRARLRRYIYQQLIEQAIFLDKIIEFNAIHFASTLRVPYAIFHWETFRGRRFYIDPTTPGTYPIFAREMITEYINTIDLYFRQRISNDPDLR